MFVYKEPEEYTINKVYALAAYSIMVYPFIANLTESRVTLGLISGHAYGSFSRVSSLRWEGCLSYFSITLKKYQEQVNLQGKC